MKYQIIDSHLGAFFNGNLGELTNGTIMYRIQDDTFILYLKVDRSSRPDTPVFVIQFKRRGDETALYSEVITFIPKTFSEFESVLLNVFLYQRFKIQRG